MQTITSAAPLLNADCDVAFNPMGLNDLIYDCIQSWNSVISNTYHPYLNQSQNLYNNQMLHKNVTH